MGSKESIVYLETLLENYNKTNIQTEMDDILYQESPTFREKLLGLFSKSNYWFEIRGTCLQAFGVDSTKFQYFILIHEKSIPNPFIFNFDLGLTFEKNINNDNDDINNYININLLKLLMNRIKERLF